MTGFSLAVLLGLLVAGPVAKAETDTPKAETRSVQVAADGPEKDLIWG
ncbi:hypothetical protein [Streptomyces sp. NPDC087300]